MIGRTLVTSLAATGARVLALDQDIPGLTSAAADWPSTVEPVVLDLADPTAIASLAEDPRLAEVDILVNNAAVTWMRSPLIDTSLEHLDLIHAVNVRATVLLSQLLARLWRDRGAPGCIVNMSSPGAARAHEHQAAYDGTKGAVESLTRAMAVEWGGLGIRVNALAPANVRGERHQVVDAPLGVSATGEDVAAATLWLASDAATIVTGQVIALDGGLLSRLRAARHAVPESAPSRHAPRSR